MQTIPGITGLRALALIIIVSYHLNQIRPIIDLPEWNWKLYQFVSMLPVIVSIFFLLGGFLRSLSYWKVFFSGDSIPSFQKGLRDRFIRIAPLFYLVLVFSFLWSWSIGRENWYGFFAGVSFLGWIHPTTFFPDISNGPLWFVAYDMIGNILVMIFLSLLIWVSRHLRVSSWYFVGGAFFLSITGLLSLHQVFIGLPFPPGQGIVSVWFPYYNPFIFGIYYLFGAFLGYIYFRFEQWKLEKHFVFDLLFLASFAWIGLYLYIIRNAGDLDFSTPKSPYRFPMVPFILALATFASIYSRFIGKILDNMIFIFLAKISYPLYLIHALIISIGLTLFFQNGFVTFQNWLYFSVGVAIVSIFLAILLSKFESLFQRKFSTK